MKKSICVSSEDDLFGRESRHLHALSLHTTLCLSQNRHPPGLGRRLSLQAGTAPWTDHNSVTTNAKGVHLQVSPCCSSCNEAKLATGSLPKSIVLNDVHPDPSPSLVPIMLMVS